MVLFEDEIGYKDIQQEEAIQKLEEVLGVNVLRNKSAIRYQAFLSKPAGFVDDDSLVVVKCPINALSKPFEALSREEETFFLKEERGMLKLSKDHDYYFEVQADMKICERQWCYFVVWSPSEFYYQLVQRDDQVLVEEDWEKLLTFQR